MRNDLKKRNALLYSTIQALEKLNYPDPSRIAQEICDFGDFDDKEVAKILNRLNNDEPWEYIRGTAFFMGEEFIVDTNVLIPRVETEILVQRVLDDVKSTKLITEIVDIGCGSGNIIVSVYKMLNEKDNFIYTATDISPKALQTTQMNASKILGAKIQGITFTKSDLLVNYSPPKTDQMIFVANLPYLTDIQLETTDKSVSKWEPHNALLGRGEHGLDIINKFLIQTSKIKTPHKIYLEIDPEQKKLLSENLPKRYIKSLPFSDQFDRQRFLYLET